MFQTRLLFPLRGAPETSIIFEYEVSVFKDVEAAVAVVPDIVNPRHACTARITVVGLCVCMCVYVCVFALICCLTHWNHKREIPTDSSQHRNH